MSESSNNGIRIGFCGILATVFIVLKLTKVIAWSWIWVLSPIWLSTAAYLAFMGILLVIGLLASRK